MSHARLPCDRLRRKLRRRRTILRMRAIRRGRFGRPVACAGVPCAARPRSADRPGFRPRARPACVVMRPALRRIPSFGGQRPSMRGCALRRRTAWYCDRPCAGYRRPAVNALRRGSCAALRPALRRIPSFGGQRPSMRGCALRRRTAWYCDRPCAGYRRPAVNALRRGSCAALRPALRRIPSFGGQRPSMRGCALRRRTAWYCDRPCAGYRRPAVNALRRGSCAALRPALRRIPSFGGQRPSMRGCALRRRTAWYCDRPCAGYRPSAVNALR